MFKVLKGFILANGFEGKVGEEVSEDKFTGTEIESLVADGSLEEMGNVAPSASNEPSEPQGEPSSDETPKGNEEV